MAVDDDVSLSVSLGRKGERDGWRVWEEKKMAQSRYKKYSQLRVHKKYIIFHIKSWFSDFIKLGS